MNKEIEKKEEEEYDKILHPMLDILDNKNITNVVSVSHENDKIYISFNKENLSEINKCVLWKIAEVYSNTIFHSDNKQSPNKDRLEYWNPDGAFKDVLDKCLEKKYYVLELNEDDKFTIIGTTIMLANCLQEQDPLQLECNKNKEVFSIDEIKRHDKYINDGSPDKDWINLSIFLNEENPLNENPYAPFMGIVNLNSKYECETIIEQVVAGYEEKRYVTFKMEEDEFIKNINKYIEKHPETNNIIQHCEIADKPKILLKFKEKTED